MQQNIKYSGGNNQYEQTKIALGQNADSSWHYPALIYVKQLSQYLRVSAFPGSLWEKVQVRYIKQRCKNPEVK